MRILTTLILSTVIAVTVTSCAKKFNHERAKEMTEAYENGDFSESDWEEFCSIYEDGADCLIVMMKDNESKTTPEMTISEVKAINEEFDKIYQIWDRMGHPVYDGRHDIPDNLSERFEAAEDKVKKTRREYYASISEKNPVYKVLKLTKDNISNYGLTPKEYWKKYSDTMTEIENIISGKSNYKPTKAQMAEIEKLAAEHKDYIQWEAKDMKMGTPESASIELTSKGLGVIALGAKASGLSKKIDGFYDSMTYEKIDHEYNMDIPLAYIGYYTFSLNGKPVAYATVDESGTIVSISVTSPEYVSPDGIKVGDPYSKISSDSRFRHSDNEMSDDMQSDNCFYVHDYNTITGIIIGADY